MTAGRRAQRRKPAFFPLVTFILAREIEARWPMRFRPQSRRLEHGKRAGRVWERGLRPKQQPLPRGAVLQHQQSPLCHSWEVRGACVWAFLSSSRPTSQSAVFACSSALRVWELDPLNRKIRPTECQTGLLKRAVECLEVRRVAALVPAAVQPLRGALMAGFVPAQISEDDQFVFCGTTSGDIMKFNLKTRLLSDYGPKRFSAKHSRVGSARVPSSALSASSRVPLTFHL